MNNKLKEMLAEVLKKYKADKEAEGYVATLELLIEDLEK
jgi:hypothetical protein